MKLVEQKAMLLEKPVATDKLGVLKYIEEIGRVCYKSEHRITDDSAPKFIRMLKDRKHWAMLEHYIFTIALPVDIFDELDMYVNNADARFITTREKGKFIQLTRIHSAGKNMLYMLSASATALNYLFEAMMNVNRVYHSKIENVLSLNKWLCDKYPDLFVSYQIDTTETRQDIRFMDEEELEDVPLPVYLAHKWVSFRYTTNRGVSHEIVRHRPASYAQSSTRYCNYSNDQFGNEITYIKPHFTDDIKIHTPWLTGIKESEDSYLEMLANGASPQQAREVLPNSLMTEMTMTANLQEWIHFINMRCPKDAHPEMRILALQVLDQIMDLMDIKDTYKQYKANPSYAPWSVDTYPYHEFFKPEVLEIMMELSNE